MTTLTLAPRSDASKRLRIAVFASLLLASVFFALAPERGAVFVRVVDVRAGLCCIIKIPGGHNIIYDTGDFEDDGTTAMRDGPTTRLKRRGPAALDDDQ